MISSSRCRSTSARFAFGQIDVRAGHPQRVAVLVPFDD